MFAYTSVNYQPNISVRCSTIALNGDRVQALTPDQSKWLSDAGWEIARSGLVALCVWGVHRLRKSIKSILPDIIKAVNAHADVRMTEHESKDDQRFHDLTSRVEAISDILRPHRKTAASGD